VLDAFVYATQNGNPHHLHLTLWCKHTTSECEGILQFAKYTMCTRGTGISSLYHMYTRDKYKSHLNWSVKFMLFLSLMRDKYTGKSRETLSSNH